MSTPICFRGVFLVGPALAMFVTGCASSVGSGTTPTYVRGVEARVGILSTCPRAGRGSRSETTLPTALAGALIPPIIDTTIDLLDSTLRHAAEEHTTTVGASTVGLFYSTSPTPFETSRPFEVRRNAENGCLVLAYGPMSKDAPTARFEGLDFNSVQKSSLQEGIGLQGNPHFYYEGRFVYSHDHTAFRIESANIRYAKTSEEGGTGVRHLELVVAFLSPSATAREKTFATATIPIGIFSTGTDLLGAPEIGTGTATTFSSPWMPLPPIGDNVKELLAEAKVAVGNLGSTLSSLKTSYIAHVDPDAVEAIALDAPASSTSVQEFLEQVKMEDIDQALMEFGDKIRLLNEGIVQKSYELDDGILKLNLKLYHEKHGLEGVDALVFERDTRLKVMAARTRLATLRSELKTAVDGRAAVKVLTTATRDLRYIVSSVELLANTVRKFGPFTVKVTLSEKRRGNPVLKFFADVFSSAKPDVARELKASLDPLTMRELEEKELKEEEARQDEFLSLRKAAALAVQTVRGAEIELRLLDANASEMQRHNAETKLQTAVFDAAYACQRSARRSAHPTECAPYL